MPKDLSNDPSWEVRHSQGEETKAAPNVGGWCQNGSEPQQMQGVLLVSLVKTIQKGTLKRRHMHAHTHTHLAMDRSGRLCRSEELSDWPNGLTRKLIHPGGLWWNWTLLRSGVPKSTFVAVNNSQFSLEVRQGFLSPNFWVSNSRKALGARYFSRENLAAAQPAMIRPDSIASLPPRIGRPKGPQMSADFVGSGRVPRLTNLTP